MRTRSTGTHRDKPGRHALPLLLAAAVLTATAATAQLPRPVSPGAVELGAVTEARCPTFSWSGVADARGYQIAVFRLPDLPGDEPALATSAQVDGDARSFTPTLGHCLERGHRYAWTVAALPRDPSSGTSDVAGGDLPWAPALLFEVEGAPSPDELERAIATLRRHLDTRPQDETADAVATALRGERLPARPRTGSPRPARTGAARDAAPRAPGADSFLPGALASPTTATRIASAGSTPLPGDASLTVSNQIHLGTASNLFKDGDVFLWDDTSGNTALGREALASVSGDATNNTAFGRGALRDTTGGGPSFLGSHNTAVGDLALHANALGFGNTASGSFALRFNTDGFENTASGFSALASNTVGYRNTASGSTALFSNTTGNGNTASGNRALYANTTGLGNTASGYKALRYNTIGSRNTANGLVALYSTTGSGNTASGYAALLSNTSGLRNTALGYKAGYYNTTNSESIFINNQGSPTDSATIKIGTGGTQTSTFVAGISGVTVSGAAVLVDGNGQLGVASSSRDVKRDISTLAPLAERLLELRPVSFRYRQLGANGDRHSDTPLEYGLVAEEVAEVFPELVIYDAHGKPQTVKYHLLGSLLLRALQEQQEVLEKQRSNAQRQQEEHRVTVQRLASRVAALESRSRR